MTRDVMTDLLPLYFAGEASEDTRTLVEQFFKDDPEFARLARTNPDHLLPLDPPIALNKDHEMRTLERTRRVVRWHGALLGLSAFLLFLPLGFEADSSTGFHWMWARFPAGAIIPFALGATGLIGWFTLRRRLRAAGL